MIPVLYRVPEWVPALGGQAITSFGALLFVALVLGGWMFVRALRGRDRLNPLGEAAGAPGGGWEIVVAAALGGMVGAKLLHLGIHAALDLPSAGLGRGGLDWLGGLIGGAAAGLWQARRAGVEPAAAAAAAAPAVAVGYAIGRLGSFLVGADYGLPTTLPWGVAFPGGAPPTTAANLMAYFGAAIPETGRAGALVRVHPTQLYEAALSLLVFAAVRRARDVRGAGGWRLAGLFLILHGFARMLVEPLRAKQDHLLGFVTADFVLAAALVAAGIVLWGRNPHATGTLEPA